MFFMNKSLLYHYQLKLIVCYQANNDNNKLILSHYIKEKSEHSDTHKSHLQVRRPCYSPIFTLLPTIISGQKYFRSSQRVILVFSLTLLVALALQFLKIACILAGLFVNSCSIFLQNMILGNIVKVGGSITTVLQTYKTKAALTLL